VRISTGVLTHDGKCWKNEPVEITDAELDEIEGVYWSYREDYQEHAPAMPFSQYLKELISLKQGLKYEKK
jgi:hypothetical protein